MDTLLIIVFFVLVGYVLINMTMNQPKYTVTDKATHAKPQHVLRDVLRDFSSGDKVNLAGDCNINLYTRNTITGDMKERFTDLLNKIFKSAYGLTHRVYAVQELSNIYEQLDTQGNGRYIVDTTINSINNYYTVKVILDIVLLNGEILINHISTNEASNNNIVNRYDMVYQDQGILLEHDNFTENIRSLLDNKYQKLHNVIVVNTQKLDVKNYPLDNVLSLTSLLNSYYPANTSTGTIQSLETKGLDGLMERYFPSDLKTVQSPEYCDKLNGENCTFQHNSTTTEYTQPYMAPGLFFDRSSFPRDY
jgi:hypothetical protein